jgi:hypothetical protein
VVSGGRLSYHLRTLLSWRPRTYKTTRKGEILRLSSVSGPSEPENCVLSGKYPVNSESWDETVRQ